MEMNEVLQAILASKKVTTDSGIERPLDYNIDSAEVEFVQSLIRKHRPRVVLEVGCAYGISSLYIGEALREHGGTKHIIGHHPGRHLRKPGRADLVPVETDPPRPPRATPLSLIT